jgi:hypothetical protein
VLAGDLQLVYSAPYRTLQLPGQSLYAIVLCDSNVCNVVAMHAASFAVQQVAARWHPLFHLKWKLLWD